MRKARGLEKFREMSLYLGAGILGAGVDFLFFCVGIALGVPVIYSQWGGATAGAVHNSLAYHYFVFSHKRKLRHTVVPNIALSGLVIAISGPALVLLGYYLDNIWLAKVIILALTAVLTYFIRKLFIFKRN
jgi:putative flippase GtrA